MTHSTGYHLPYSSMRHPYEQEKLTKEDINQFIRFMKVDITARKMNAEEAEEYVTQYMPSGLNGFQKWKIREEVTGMKSAPEPRPINEYQPSQWRSQPSMKVELAHLVAFSTVDKMFTCTCWTKTKNLWCSHIKEFFLDGVDVAAMTKHRTPVSAFSLFLPFAGGWARSEVNWETFQMSKLLDNPDLKGCGVVIRLPFMDNREVWLDPTESLLKVINIMDDWARADPELQTAKDLHDPTRAIKCKGRFHASRSAHLAAKMKLAVQLEQLDEFLIGELYSMHCYKRCTMCHDPVNIRDDVPVF